MPSPFTCVIAPLIWVNADPSTVVIVPFVFASMMASVFTFNPPPGTKVTESGSAPTSGDHSTEAPLGDSGEKGAAASADKPKLVGSGWTSVVVAKVPTGGATDTSSGPGSLSRMLKALPRVSDSWGSGHLLQGTLFSALLTDDGRLVVGAVAPDKLYAALGS